MPDKAQHFCNWAGCDELTYARYCEKHTEFAEAKRLQEKQRYQKTRPSASKQGYDGDWQKIRMMYLRRNPICEECLKGNKVTPAVLVHHKIRIVDGGSRLDTNNLQSLCESCHNQKHRHDRWAK